MTAPLILGYRVNLSGACALGSCDECADVACGCLDCHDVADTTVDWSVADDDASYVEDDTRHRTAGR